VHPNQPTPPPRHPRGWSRCHGACPRLSLRRGCLPAAYAAGAGRVTFTATGCATVTVRIASAIRIRSWQAAIPYLICIRRECRPMVLERTARLLASSPALTSLSS
jgi:hypothetical protein